MDRPDPYGGPSPQPNLPPGFRFHPTDEELVVHYLKRKATSAPLPVAIIADVDLYKFDPWELPAKAAFGEEEWYFFSPRDRKYPNGARPNRAATSGYWKATGTDKPVLASGGKQKVGVKKVLVFYGGKPPKGIKTNWIMHEYRLTDNKVNNKPPGLDFSKKKNSLRLDDWVLCRIYKKNSMSRNIDKDKDDPMDDIFGNIPQSISISGFQNLEKTNAFRPRNSVFLNCNENIYEGMVINNGNVTHHDGNNYNNNIGLHLAGSSSKRALPPPYWAMEEGGMGAATAAAESPSERFQGVECSNLSSFLAQPQPLVSQQAMLGDGIFRPPHQLSGLNWYS